MRNIESQFVSHLDTLNGRRGDGCLHTLVNVVFNVSISINVPQKETVDFCDADRTTEASFPALIFCLVVEPVHVVVCAPVNRCRDYQTG